MAIMKTVHSEPMHCFNHIQRTDTSSAFLRYRWRPIEESPQLGHRVDTGGTFLRCVQPLGVRPDHGGRLRGGHQRLGQRLLRLAAGL